jgi:glycosyltransferase involved in cell wall biosynthesis
MVGTEIGGQGGIGSVIRGYQSSGLFDLYPIVYVTSHRGGGKLSKAAAAVVGWALVLGALVRMDAPLVHIHVASRWSFWRKYIVCLLARAFHRPYVLHVHGAEFAHFFHYECRPSTQHIIRSVFDGAARVVALSREWQTELLKISSMAQIVVVPNTVALPGLAATGIGSRARTRKRILFMGQLGKRKGTSELIRAFARIAPYYPDASLACAGDGDATSFRKLAMELGVAERVEFPGWLNAEQSRQYFAGATVFALPSYAEGVPMALLEAMSWGLAVVTCPVGGIPEVVMDGQNGILVKPGDINALANALSDLFDDPDYLTRLAKEARATIERSYSLDATLARLGDLYSSFGIKARVKDESGSPTSS